MFHCLPCRLDLVFIIVCFNPSIDHEPRLRSLRTTLFYYLFIEKWDKQMLDNKILKATTWLANNTVYDKYYIKTSWFKCLLVMVDLRWLFKWHLRLSCLMNNSQSKRGKGKTRRELQVGIRKSSLLKSRVYWLVVYIKNVIQPQSNL